jgi:hypothetical protein
VVVPTQVTIPNAYEAFNDKGELKSTDQQTKLKQEIEQLLDK